jgi:hypothetical protein
MKKTILATMLVVFASSSSAMAFWGKSDAKETCHKKHERHEKGGKKGHKKGHHDIFGKLDINSDQKITKTEFLDDATKRFAEIDANNDGNITKGELKKHHKKMKKEYKKGRKSREKDEK